ncbi:AraC family transcriptional regulator [Maricaulis sp.]|uniref:helix-turn-helix domain-containing protein n=1 Tax=Maricaulis sp. TaxID=1486257 RepID=UPI0026048747|nr:AraC family transcriptional regulator [Maricaulis sp.]
MNATLLGVLYFAAATHAVMITLVLAHKTGGRGPGLLLAVITGMMAYKLFEGGMMYAGFYASAPHLLDLLPGMVLILGPVFYAYVRRMTGHAPYPVWLWAVQLLPAAAVWLSNAPLVLQPAADKVAMWDTILAPGSETLPGAIILRLVAIKLFLLAYLILSWRMLSSYAARIDTLRADDSRSLLSQMRFLAISLLALEAVWVVLFLAQQGFGLGTLSQVSSAWLLFMAAIILTMGYRGMQDANFLLTPEERSLAETPQTTPASIDTKVKYLHSALPDSASQEIAELIETRLREHQDYLDERLTLTQLSANIGMKSHTISQVINQYMGSNFYKLVNGYRIQHAVDLIDDAKQHLPLERIAIESGFSNRVTFNKAFKASLDMTPSEYRARARQAS